MLKICETCGDEFETRKKTAKYCSKICHDEFQRGHSRIYPQLNNRVWLYKCHVTEDKTLQEIADEVGCSSTTTVEQKLKFFDIKPHLKGFKGKFSKKEDKEIIRFYEKHGTAATRAKFECSYGDINNMRRRTGTALVTDYQDIDSKNGCIYRIIFDLDNDSLYAYVGRTERPSEERWRQHELAARNGLQNSLYKTIRESQSLGQELKWEIVREGLSKNDICAAENNEAYALEEEGYILLNDCPTGGGVLAGYSAKKKRALRQERLALFDRFYDREKHGLVSQNHIEDEINLGGWISKQRSRYKKGQISIEEIDEFEKHEGWIWNTYQFIWNTNINEYKKFVKEYTNRHVPQSYVTPSGVKLGVFVASCRAAYKENERSPLNDKQKLELKNLGWMPTAPQSIRNPLKFRISP